MRLRHVALRTADPASLRPFYADALGLPVADTDDGFVVAVGESSVEFRRARDGGADDRAPAGDDTAPTYHFAFSAPGGTADAAADWLADRATVLTHEGRRTTDYDWLDATAVYFGDPAGNVLELIARGGREGPGEADPGDFGPDSLLDLAEIGLVVDDVVGLADRLTAAFDAPGEPNDDGTFAYLGDEAGAFVLAEPGRAWFPTDRAAEPHPVTVAATGLTGESTAVSAPGIAVVGVRE